MRRHVTPHTTPMPLPKGLHQHLRSKAVLTGMSLLIAVSITGCGLVRHSLRQAPAQERDFGPAISVATRMQNDSPISKLAFYPNGPGVVICTPVASTGLSNFGQGVGGWLEVEVAGQTQFGKSPAFANLKRAAQEMHSPGLAIDTPQRAGRLTRIAGATVAALGTLRGAPGHCRLTYRLYSLSDNRPVGAPITAEGSEEQIAAQLPAIAAKLARGLGAAHPHIPGVTGLSAADLEFLGPLSTTMGNVTAAQRAKLQTLARHATLAAVLSLRSAHDSPAAGPAADLLLMKSSNPIAVSEVAIDLPEALAPHAEAIQDLANQNPENYLYALSSVWLYRQIRQPLQERKAAEATMQCAPNSPDAWLTLGYTISNEAQGIRHAKSFDDMTSQEQDFVTALYPDWVYCTKHATELDPFFGKAWLRLATASTFDGDKAQADTAFWQALKLDPEKAEVYPWGLEMYQPKWFDDPTKLATVAGMAANENYATQADVDTIAQDLADAGFTHEEEMLRNRYTARN